MSIGVGVDELGGYANCAAGLANAPFHYVPHAKRCGNIANAEVPALELER